jgi:fucose permease
VFLHRSQHASLGIAALGVAVYSVGTIVGRLGGDSLITRWGRLKALRRTAVLAGAGLTAAVLANSPAVALVAYGVLGLGVSMIVPIAFSSAGRIVGMPAVRALARVTTAGYGGSFVGPAVIGVVASGTGLADALLIPVALLLLIVPLSVALDRSGFQA